MKTYRVKYGLFEKSFHSHLCRFYCITEVVTPNCIAYKNAVNNNVSLGVFIICM